MLKHTFAALGVVALAGAGTAALLPTAMAKDSMPYGGIQLAACNPCAAKPCAAANPCNPCAARKPTANPCAAANPSNPCAATNPCAAKK